MGKIIRSNLENCVGCNRCVREGPIETANLTYQDAQGNIKVDVDDAQCIACGRCIQVCRHGARSYEDDLERFFDDLDRGVPLSLITAPSLKSNFSKWKNILAWLKQKGVRKIYDVSLGADICIWAHLRYLEAYQPSCLVPAFDGTIMSSEWKEIFWDRFYTAAPQQQRQCVEQYKIVKRA